MIKEYESYKRKLYLEKSGVNKLVNRRQNIPEA